MLRALILYTLGCSLLLHSVSSSPLASSGSSDERSQDGQNCSPCEQRQKLADSFGLTSIKGGVKKNGLYIGLFPNDDETLCDLEGVVDAPFVFHGRYAQLSRGENWDAKQIWSIADDLKKTKAILQISLMPEATWWGLTKDNNCQAQAIADQIAKIQSQTNSNVWLRFAPDMNYYQTGGGGGKYGTDKSAFLTAWTLVSKAVKEKAPDAKMIWSPTYTDTASVFHDYWPQHALPDVVGMAYAPESKPDTASFLKQMQKFHDDFSGPKRPFILAQASPMTKKITEQDRIDFLNTVTSTNAIESLPHYIGLTYFIYPPSRAHKRLIIYPALHADKRIIILDKESAPDTDKSKMNSLTKAWIHE